MSHEQKVQKCEEVAEKLDLTKCLDTREYTTKRT